MSRGCPHVVALADLFLFTLVKIREGVRLLVAFFGVWLNLGVGVPGSFLVTLGLIVVVSGLFWVITVQPRSFPPDL